MQNVKRIITPLHCRCRVYNTQHNSVGDKCQHCGCKMTHGTPNIRQIERQMQEDQAIDRIMVT